MLCINRNVLENSKIDNNFLNNFDINKLWDEFEKTSDKHYNINMDMGDIKEYEMKIFHNIFNDIFFFENNFINYYMDEIEQRYNKNKKNTFKINIDNIIDKFITNIIKKTDIKLYKKYMSEKTNFGYINHIKLILFIDKILYFPENTAFLVLYLTFKDNLTNENFLSCIYKNNYDSEKTLNEYNLLKK